MTQEIIAIDKPRYGEPCNGCGYCCRSKVCRIGEAVLSNGSPEMQAAPCALLIEVEGAYRCGVVLMEAKDPSMDNTATRALGIGWGCDSDDPD